jgi:hypothetical protein
VQLPSISHLDTFKLKLNVPNMENPFFEGVFEKMSKQLNVPEFKAHFKLSDDNRKKGISIFNYNNENSFLSVHRFENAKLFLFTSPFEEEAGNFIKHALYVPTFLRIGMESVLSKSLFYFIGNNELVNLKTIEKTSDVPIRVVGEKSGFEFIPELKKTGNGLKLIMNNQVIDPDFYQIKYNAAILSIVGFNHNRQESNLRFHDINHLNSIISDNNWKSCKVFDSSDNNQLDSELKEGGQGVKLWKLFIGLTLLFLLLEILILRLFK